MHNGTCKGHVWLSPPLQSSTQGGPGRSFIISQSTKCSDLHLPTPIGSNGYDDQRLVHMAEYERNELMDHFSSVRVQNVRIFIFQCRFESMIHGTGHKVKKLLEQHRQMQPSPGHFTGCPVPGEESLTTPENEGNILTSRAILTPEDYKPELGSLSTAANHSSSEPMIAKSQYVERSVATSDLEINEIPSKKTIMSSYLDGPSSSEAELCTHSANGLSVATGCLNVMENAKKYLIFLKALQVIYYFQTSKAVLLLIPTMFKTFPMAPSARHCLSKFPPRQISVQWNEPKNRKLRSIPIIPTCSNLRIVPFASSRQHASHPGTSARMDSLLMQDALLITHSTSADSIQLPFYSTLR
ncbi:hypothetical protein CAEBREN_13256 [Caenorhabditis brenneri]|uniref:Uncharacterized protein n=1 Tax=Caenorhabditis brenneri TaxID=135651 RepID=G0NDY5_CAEBE|nr:hypothetical protein CAEBREN_13256 [Caenorhabditis brenneri]